MVDIQGIDDLMIPLRPDQLDPNAVIAQSLDNQWATAQLTEEMIRDGKSLRQVAGQRET